MSLQPTPLMAYASGIGNCIHALSKHVQHLVGHIPTPDMPTGWDTIEQKYFIVATDLLVLFGVGYHSWVIATYDEEILFTVSGPYDGDPLLMTPYCSELVGLAAGLAVLGTLARSGIINVRFVKCICDNKSAILARKRQPSESIFHKKETDYDAISTIHELQAIWCDNIDIK
jgi:hypothetical protein